MKYLFLILLIFVSCTQDEVEAQNKVLVLKLDYTTTAFEEGVELGFENSSTFTITSTYNQPNDFGSVNLQYAELNQPLFDGTIVWMGNGFRTYPSVFNPSTSFQTTANIITQPDDSRFMKVDYHSGTIIPRTDDNSILWNSIENLEKVQSYLTSNPTAKIYVLEYKSSVGIGDPNEWDFYLFIKN